MHKLGRNVLLNNNVLVLKFNDLGILEEKLFYDKTKMNEYKFVEVETENVEEEINGIRASWEEINGIIGNLENLKIMALSQISDAN